MVIVTVLSIPTAQIREVATTDVSYSHRPAVCTTKSGYSQRPLVKNLGGGCRLVCLFPQPIVVSLNSLNCSSYQWHVVVSKNYSSYHGISWYHLSNSWHSLVVQCTVLTFFTLFIPNKPGKTNKVDTPISRVIKNLTLLIHQQTNKMDHIRTALWLFPHLCIIAVTFHTDYCIYLGYGRYFGFKYRSNVFDLDWLFKCTGQFL